MNKNISNDRLLSIDDVVQVTGLCRRIASVLMDETGKAIIIHRRKFIFASDLLGYLRGIADNGETQISA